MAHATEGLVESGIDAYLRRHEEKSLLRFLTCGSVDDGKSTLIGRLLYDAHLVLEDHLAALTTDSKAVGTQGGDLDFALLVDGLSAEREQGITIDVAYRYFTTERRKFIVADTPGHEQYTRNMVTGASTADLAVLLVDARKGVVTQTRRHSHVVALLGIRHVVVAVNKLDAVNYDRHVFERIEADYRSFADALGLRDVVCIPMSALRGDNVITRSQHMPWYDGPTLLEHLESVDIDDESIAAPFRFPVQWVNRPNSDFRGFSGRVARGSVRPGDPVLVLPSGRATRVERIVTADGDLDVASADQAVTLTLSDEVDVSRGDVLVAADAPAGVADRFRCHLVWMHEEPMLPGRAYLLKLGTRTALATVAQPKHKINVDTLEPTAARTLELNEIGVCNLVVDRPVVFDAYRQHPDLGGFVLVDRTTFDTVAAGMIDYALRRADNLHWQPVTVDRDTRAAQKGQRGAVVWFTGLSGAGKSTVANLVDQRLYERGHHTFLLDGDNVRLGLNRDLGFTEADRVENIRRVAEVGKLMADAGLIVLCAFISPFRAERQMARELLGPGEFVEVFVDAPLEVAEGRDPKGLYAKARRGELANFTGIDSPYEPPEAPEVHLDAGGGTSAAVLADQVVDHLQRTGLLAPPLFGTSA
jgi:bifunctional enzyme CysN/CysC